MPGGSYGLPKLVHRIGTLPPLARNRFPTTKSPQILNGGTTSARYAARQPPPTPAAAPQVAIPPAAPARQEGFNSTIATLFALIVPLCSSPTSSSHDRARPLCRPLPRSRPLHPPNARQNAGRQHRRPPARRWYLNKLAADIGLPVATQHQARLSSTARCHFLRLPPPSRARPHAALLPGFARYRRNSRSNRCSSLLNTVRSRFEASISRRQRFRFARCPFPPRSYRATSWPPVR